MPMPPWGCPLEQTAATALAASPDGSLPIRVHTYGDDASRVRTGAAPQDPTLTNHPRAEDQLRDCLYRVTTLNTG